MTALAGALTLACRQGYIRVFADEGPPMAALLTRLIAAQRAAQAAAGSRSAAWRGSSAHLTPGTLRRIPGETPPQRRQASSSR